MDSTTPQHDCLMLHVFPQVASQRFAFSAENIDPTPWRWQVVLDATTVMSSGNASFRLTAIVKGRIALAWERHAFAVERRTKRRTKRHENSDSPDGSDD